VREFSRLHDADDKQTTKRAAMVMVSEPRRRQLRLLVVDDHEVVREGLIATFRGRYEIVDAVATGAEALALIAREPVDVAIVDFRLPDMSGDVVCRALRRAAPKLAVIILTTYASPTVAQRALRAGASAYITKAEGLPALYEALSDLERHGAPSPEARMEQIMTRLLPVVGAEATDMSVTPQQENVLELASSGLTNREIGTRLYISESTVRFHLQNLKATFGARSKTDLIARAIRNGVISPSDEDRHP
jgi:DNA-binding NarL/FixJ family response regulator